MDNQPPQEPQTPTPTPAPTPTPISPETPPQPQQPAPSTDAPTKATPVLGFVGLGLAVLGTILAFIPAILIIGIIVLLAAFIVSLVAVFNKNTAKWPAIAGMILSVVAGIIGSIIFVLALAVALTDRVNEELPTNTPSTNEQSNNSPDTESSKDRPSPEEIAKGIKTLNQEGGIRTYDNMPAFYPCVGDFIYKSDLSDETVGLLIEGYDPVESERELATEVIQNSVFTCDPQPFDKNR